MYGVHTPQQSSPSGSRADEALVDQFKGPDITRAPCGKDFKLTDHDQQARTLADFKGKVVMLYFGVVPCPDVCPTALNRAVETRPLLGADGERLQVIFVTVDPERDTAQTARTARTAKYYAHDIALLLKAH